jgi:vancomycin permeability regulator SanA
MALSASVKTIVVSIIIALLLYLAYEFVDLQSGNSTTTVARADCLVILGAAVWPGGQPSPVLRDRIARAAQLYHEGVADKIICSGGVGKYPPAEAEVEKQLLLKTGVAEKDIILEPSSFSTAQQAVRIKEICDREGFSSIALVTSFYHEKRATQLFRGAGFTRIEDARCTHERFEDLNYWVARETLALALLNWWRWAAIGTAIGILALKFRRVRRHERPADV